MTLVLNATAAFIALTLALDSCSTPRPPRITVVSGSRPDGSATELWLTVLRRRLPAPVYDSVALIRRQRTPQENAWAELIRIEARDWPRAADSLTRLFDLPGAQDVTLVLGDRGAEDAFTHDSLTMGMDVAALHRIYGEATDPENPDRVRRFIRHEFVHTLQKRWLARNPFVPKSPLDEALLDAWAEGLGNYYSLSSRWRPAGREPSPDAATALGELEPRFVGRMVGLACADSAAAQPLLAGLSSGPFTQKWGALPVALWLLAEETRHAGALHAFATRGPTAVWTLAHRQLRPALADSLALAQRTAEHCAL
jgi:hypothetical protein